LIIFSYDTRESVRINSSSSLTLLEEKYLIDRPLAKVTKQPKHGLEQFIMTLIHEMTGMVCMTHI